MVIYSQLTTFSLHIHVHIHFFTYSKITEEGRDGWRRDDLPQTMSDRWQTPAGISTSHSCHCCMSQREAVVRVQRNACLLMVPHHNKNTRELGPTSLFAGISTHTHTRMKHHALTQRQAPRSNLISTLWLVVMGFPNPSGHVHTGEMFSAAAASFDISFESRSPLERACQR